MVSNITSLPAFLTSAVNQNRQVSDLPDGEQASHAGRSAVEVSVSDSAYRSDVLTTRGDVASARGGVELALGVGRVARGALVDLRDLAERAADPGTPDDVRRAQDGQFRAAVQGVGQRIQNEISAGAQLIAGDALQVQANPDADTPLTIEGFDLRVKQSPSTSGVISLSLESGLATREAAASSAQAADVSIAKLDAHLRRLDKEYTRLDQHDQVLSALDLALKGAGAADLDADGARLLALQVKQDLSQNTSPISSAGLSSVLSYFRG